MTANNNNIEIGIREEVCKFLVVSSLWIIDSAMRSRFCGSRICWGSRPLQKSIDRKIGIGQYEGQMEAFGREPLEWSQ